MPIKEKSLVTPVSDRDISQLEVGDVIYINGPLFTGRDAVLPRLIAAIKAGEYHGPDIAGGALFHTAVSPAGIGPTSSNKLEIESSILPLSAMGLKIHIGKGELNRETIDGMAKFNAIYAVTPPVTALFNDCVTSRRVVMCPDFGMEAMNLLIVHDFPIIVAAAKGVSIYDE